MKNEEGFDLVLHVEDWPLVNDPELGLGPHVVVQVDDAPPIRISKKKCFKSKWCWFSIHFDLKHFLDLLDLLAGPNLAYKVEV